VKEFLYSGRNIEFLLEGRGDVEDEGHKKTIKQWANVVTDVK
jgi:hypothetical protein